MKPIFKTFLSEPSSSGWNKNGSTATSTDFLGTINNADLILKTDNTERMRIAATGDIGIGVTNPIEKLEVGGNIKGYGNAEFNGNLKLASSISFSNNKGIKYTSAGNGSSDSYDYGIVTGNYTPIAVDQCLIPGLTARVLHRFNGSIQCYGNTPSGQYTNVLSMGFDGANGYIDLAGQNDQGEPKLLINYYCGKDVVIGNPGVNSANLTVAGNIDASSYWNCKKKVDKFNLEFMPRFLNC